MRESDGEKTNVLYSFFIISKLNHPLLVFSSSFALICFVCASGFTVALLFSLARCSQFFSFSTHRLGAASLISVTIHKFLPFIFFVNFSAHFAYRTEYNSIGVRLFVEVFSLCITKLTATVTITVTVLKRRRGLMVHVCLMTCVWGPVHTFTGSHIRSTLWTNCKFYAVFDFLMLARTHNMWFISHLAVAVIRGPILVVLPNRIVTDITHHWLSQSSFFFFKMNLIESSFVCGWIMLSKQ